MEFEFDFEFLAYIGICIVSINLFPQIYLIVKNKNADSVSYLTYIMNIITYIMNIVTYIMNIITYIIIFNFHNLYFIYYIIFGFI